MCIHSNKKCLPALELFLKGAYFTVVAEYWYHHSSTIKCSLVPRRSKLEGAPGTHCLRMCSSPGFSGELGNFHKIYSVTLTSVCQSISLVWTMPAIDHDLLKRWRGNDENTQHFTCKNFSPVHSFQVNTVAREWCNLSLWSSSIALNKMIQATAVKMIAVLTFKTQHNSEIPSLFQ